MKRLLLLPALACLFFSCVPKDQYDSLVIERNYYRNKTVEADSLADIEALKTYDRRDDVSTEQASMIRELESVKATNLALNESYQAMVNRYNELLAKDQQLLADNGAEVTGLQASLAQRTLEVSQREARAREKEISLQSREAAIARVETEGTATPSTEPAAYGRVTPAGAAPKGMASQNNTLRLNTLQSELAQQLSYLPATAYVISPAGANQLQLSLADGLITTDGYALSLEGQNLLRRLAYTIVKYQDSDVTIIGHADGGDEDAQVAYEESTDKAIMIAQQMVAAGLNPSKLTAAGKGFYAPVASSATPEGRSANRRIDLLIGLGR